jgi:hypothetical protein
MFGNLLAAFMLFEVINLFSVAIDTERYDMYIEYITPNVPLVSLTNVPDISLLNVPLFTGCN